MIYDSIFTEIFLVLCRFEWVTKFQFTAGEENHVHKISNISVSPRPPFCKLDFGINALQNAIRYPRVKVF